MGEEPSEDPESFAKQKKWKRAVVISSGPFVNITAGILALLVLFSVAGFASTTIAGASEGSQAAAAGILKGDRIISLNSDRILTTVDYTFDLNFIDEDKAVTVKVVRPGVETPLEFELVPVQKSVYRLGITTQIDQATSQWKIVDVADTSNGGNPVLQTGDVLLAINGVDTADQKLASAQIAESNGEDVSILLLRDGKEITVTSITTLAQYYTDRGLVFTGAAGFKAAFGESFRYSISVIKLTFRGIGKIFTGEIAAKDGLSGPVGVVDMVGGVVTQTVPIADKLENLLWMFALISLNLGVFNLLPIPALDGSHLLLIVIEAIRKKRLSQNVEGRIVFAGFLIIIALAILGFVFDIMRITGRS
jgi:regulator of sigma E protease